MWHAVELNPDGQIINKSHFLLGCLSELLYADSAREVLEDMPLPRLIETLVCGLGTLKAQQDLHRRRCALLGGRTRAVY